MSTLTGQFHTSGVSRRWWGLPRSLHPGAWWTWALGCAVVASRTTNPLIIVGVIAVVCLTVILRRGNSPWALGFRLYVYLGCLIVVLRLILRIIFSAAGPTILFPLPTLTLPGVFSSVRLLGPVSAEALISSGVSGLQLAAMILAVGAANSLANPKRLLAAVPSALYEWGTVVVIALSVFPQLAESLGRVRRARQLRAETGKGAHLIRYVAMPVLSDALDRSLLLAGSMDSRGYGRSSQVLPGHRRLTSAMMVFSSLALCVGAYGLLDLSAPWWRGTPMVIGGALVGFVALKLVGRRVMRSRYRPDSLTTIEWVVMGCAITATALMVVLGKVQPQVVFFDVAPLAWPSISAMSLVVLMILALPTLVTPAPDRSSS